MKKCTIVLPLQTWTVKVQGSMAEGYPCIQGSCVGLHPGMIAQGTVERPLSVSGCGVHVFCIQLEEMYITCIQTFHCMTSALLNSTSMHTKQ